MTKPPKEVSTCCLAKPMPHTGSFVPRCSKCGMVCITELTPPKEVSECSACGKEVAALEWTTHYQQGCHSKSDLEHHHHIKNGKWLCGCTPSDHKDECKHSWEEIEPKIGRYCIKCGKTITKSSTLKPAPLVDPVWSRETAKKERRAGFINNTLAATDGDGRNKGMLKDIMCSDCLPPKPLSKHRFLNNCPVHERSDCNPTEQLLHEYKDPGGFLYGLNGWQYAELWEIINSLIDEVDNKWKARMGEWLKKHKECDEDMCKDCEIDFMSILEKSGKA